MLDGGNPFSGPEWYLPTIGIGIDTEYQDEADIYFNKLTDSLKTNSRKKNYYLFQLLEFFYEQVQYNKRTLSEEKFNRWLEDKKIEYGII